MSVNTTPNKLYSKIGIKYSTGWFLSNTIFLIVSFGKIWLELISIVNSKLLVVNLFFKLLNILSKILVPVFKFWACTMVILL
jgi:hypothetical protein